MKAGTSAIIFAALAAIALWPGQAQATCQLQWQPDPFGGSGGSLVYVCDDPSAPTGGGGNSGGNHGKKKPQYATMAVNMTTLYDGDNTFSGSYSAGYVKAKKAVRKAKGACRRDQPGRCKDIVTARNGWAALVVTAEPDGTLRVFGGNAKKREPAFREATRKARSTLGDDLIYPIERVRAVRSRVRR